MSNYKKESITIKDKNYDIFIGKNAVVLGTSDAIDVNTGVLNVKGGVGISGNIFVGGYNGGTTSYTNYVNFGRITCYSLQSLNMKLYNLPRMSASVSPFLIGLSGP